MKFQRLCVATLFITILAIGCLSFGFYKYYKHNEFHRSRMVQYQYLNRIRDLAENNINKLVTQFPEIEKFENYYVLSPNSEKISNFLNEKGVKKIDFYGYYFEFNSEGTIIYADLHKP